MAKRRFELPGIQDLTKEQERARLLPLDGQHLIVGGPGTGKSILALLRSGRLAREGAPYAFLVFNHLLKRANEQLFGEQLASHQWQSWFIRTFSRTIGHELPRLPAGGRDPLPPFDWAGIVASADSLDPERQGETAKPVLVIDEGQDMPPQFYETLLSLGFENFFVVADQNQQITDDCSSRQEIEDGLGIETRDVIELRENFRNSRAVAKLARHFYTDDPASPPPDIPGGGEASTPILFTYPPGELDSLARRIVRRVDQKPSRLIGVIAPSNAVRTRYFDALRRAAPVAELDNGPPRVETFHADCRPPVAFDRGGILVIAVQACKGLEFDEVFCADIDEYRPRSDDLDATRKQFYVMVARARERVFLLRRQGPECPVDRILPSDPAVLRRREAERREA